MARGLNLAEIVEHGRTELATATGMCAHHRPLAYGLCRCGRVCPCDVAAKYEAYARYWKARLVVAERDLAALGGPTVVLRTV